MRPQKTITLFICTSQIALALKAIADPKGLFYNRRVAGTHAELGDEIPGFAPRIGVSWLVDFLLHPLDEDWHL